jgi:xylulokinase
MRSEATAPFLIGIDCGTQSVRAIAFDGRGRKVAETRRSTPAKMLDGGRGQYDPAEMFATVVACLHEVAQALGGRPVAGLAVASMGESCVLIDERGKPLAPSLVWFDRRPEEASRRLVAKIGAERAFAIAGLSIEPIFTLCKLAWMREHWPEAVTSACRMLCMADWIAYRLCGVAATDLTLASRTFCLDIHARRWSEELFALAGLDAALGAPLVASGTALGPVLPAVLSETGISGTPIVAAGAHDHLAGALALGITRPGILLDSLGTAEFLLQATDAPLDDPAVLERGLNQGAIATHRAFSYLGGGINSSGGSVEWLRTMLGGPPHAALIDEASEVPPGSGGIVFLPHLAYAPPPAPDTIARGAFVGLTAAASRGALYRAVLEGLAMQANRMATATAALPGVGAPREIRADGGNTRNPLFMQIKASVFGAPITIVDEPEATALGAALLGGVAAGVWPDLDTALATLDRSETVVRPEPAATEFYGTLQAGVFDPLQTTLKPTNQALAGLTQP